ncbi:TPA: hypothetical protein KFM58_001695 [Escherichia coli]|nr:hypothetical protein [Escherichia coli]
MDDGLDNSVVYSSQRLDGTHCSAKNKTSFLIQNDTSVSTEQMNICRSHNEQHRQ